MSEDRQQECQTRTWPQGVIYWRFAHEVISDTCGGRWTDGQAMTNVRMAMEKWSVATGRVVTFVEQAPNVGNPVKIHKSTYGGAWPGAFTPGMDVCLNPNDPWNTMHEIGHGIGLWHTMQRADRDRYIKLNASFWCGLDNDAGYWDVMARCGHDRMMYTDNTHTTLHGNRHTYGSFDLDTLMTYDTGCRSGTCDNDFKGCTDGVCTIIPRGGGIISLVASVPPDPIPNPTPSDVSAVTEMYAEDRWWQKFRPSPTADPGRTSPYDFSLAAGVSLKGSPAITRYIGGNVVYARGSDNRLYAKFSPDRTGPWIVEALTGVTGDPAAQWRGEDRLEVVIPKGNEVIYRAHRPATGWRQSSLGTPGRRGDIAGLAIATPSVDVVSVFTIRDGQIWHKRYANEAWGDWKLISTAALTGKPAAESWGFNRIDVVATRASDGSIERLFSTDGGLTWNADNLGGIANAGTSPAIASRASGTLSVFATGINGVLFERKFVNGAWENWRMIGGLLEGSSPGAYGHGSTIFLAGSIRERTPANSTTRGLWLRTYAVCPNETSNGQADGFCSDICPCNEGQGDCDDLDHGTDCVGALVCGENLGARYGMPPNYDVCVHPSCLEPGGTDNCSKNCTCGVGGACLVDEQCRPNLRCLNGACAPY